MKNAYFKYIAALLLFGLNGIVASYIALNSYEIVLTRTLMGSMLLVPVFIATRQKAHCWENRTHLFYLAISGLSLGTSWMFLYEAYRQIGVSIASLAYYCGPVIVMALAPILFKEKITFLKVFSFLAVLAGMFFVNIQAWSGGKPTWGLFCGIMSAAMYASMVIFNKKAKSITGLENSMWQLITSFVIVAIFLAIKGDLPFHIESGSVIPILILGIVNTGAGCYFYFSSISDLPVQTIAICGYLEPLSAVIFAAIFLNEKMDCVQIIGAMLILGGAACGELLGNKITQNANASQE